MKRIIEKKLAAFILTTVGIFSTLIINAQWQKKASGFSTPRRGFVELIAVGDNVAWGIGADAFNPVWEVPPSSDFTRTTDGGNHWTAGKVSAFPDYTLVGIAPLSATLCYGSLANFDNGNTKVVKTTDGGVTWTEQFNYDFGEPFSFFADIYFFNANDGGNNWTKVPEANMPVALTDEFSYVFSSEGIGNTFWTVSTSGRIWKSLDKGLHWAAYETGEGYIEFSNLKMRDELHGLWGVHGELYRTSDGGITWTDVEYSGTWFTNDLAYVPGTTATYVSTGAHDFPGYAENGSLHGIGTSYSVDDGNTWITLDTAVEHFCVTMINSYNGFTGGINTNASNGIFKYNGPALGYSCENNLTTMCHKGNTICVANASIANHLSHGDFLGACPSSNTINNKAKPGIEHQTKALTIYPNPVVNSTTVSFSVTQAGNVSIRIFDLSGRVIATLVNKKMPAGNHQLAWNANDENGNAVPSGIYLLRLNTGCYSETKKLSVIK
jgi:FlgD Ig-like domain